MSAATTLSRQVYDINAGDLETVRDPGDAGTIRVSNKGFYRVEIVSAGAETRALEAATALPAFTEATLVFKTDGGNVTVTAGTNTIVLTDAGQIVKLCVVPTAAGNVWAIVGGNSALVQTTLLTAQGLPDDITGDISAYNETTLKAVLTALALAGIITDSTTT